METCSLTIENEIRMLLEFFDEITKNNENESYDDQIFIMIICLRDLDRISENEKFTNRPTD